MSTHIDRNQTVISHLKNISSGKSENDVEPQKQSALKQLQAVGSAMEDKSDSLKDEMEQLQELLKNFGGSKTEVRLITSLFKKINEQMGEMHKLHGDIQAQSEAVDTAAFDENGSDGSGDPVGAGRPLPPPIPPPVPPAPPPPANSTVSSVSIGSGAQVIAARILLELQEEYSKLQALLQEILQDNLSHSTDFVKALSHAASDSLTQEANNQRLESYNSWAGAGTTAASLAYTVKSGYSADAESRPIQTQQQTLALHEADLQGVARARATISDAPPRANRNRPQGDQETLMNEHKDRLLNNRFDADAAPHETRARLNAYKFMTPEEKAAVAKNLNEKLTQKSNELSAVQTKHSRQESTFSSGTQLLKGSTDAITKDLEAANTLIKAADEGQRSVSQDTTEKLNQAISKNRDDVNAAAQDGKKALDVRNAIIQDNHGTKG